MIENLKRNMIKMTIVDHIVEALMFTKKNHLAKNLEKPKMKSNTEKKVVVQEDIRMIKN